MQIKGFEIVREIHRGSITTVYEALQVSLERKVLLKVLNKQWLGHADLVERIGREAKICARLDHPNLVKIYDFQFNARLTYISMEYVAGQSLANLLRANGPLSAQDIRDYGIQLLRGLGYAHQKGALHRDIKPDNILVAADGTIKITDFGLATLHSLSGVTQQGNIVGSPAYMAPEVLRGAKADIKADIFSLGVTLYEMCTASNPFLDEDNIGASIQNVLLRVPPSPAKLREDLPDFVADSIDAMLQKDPRLRPESCEAVLSKWTDKRPAPAAMQMRHTVPRPGLKVRHKKTVLLLLLLISAVLGYRIFERNFFIKEEITNPAVVPPVKDTVSVLTAAQDANSRETPVRIERKPSVDKRDQKNKSVLTPEPAEANTDNRPASLFVAAKPWAEIWIDGRKKEVTPLRRAIVLPPGRYQLKLINPYCQVLTREIMLSPAQQETLRVRMTPVTGQVEIRVKPWAKVKIDGRDYGASPLTQPLIIAAGEHKIELNNPELGVVRDTFVLRPRQEKNLRYNLTKLLRQNE